VAAIKTLQAEMRDRATLLRELRTTSNRGVERAHARLAREHSKANQDARARRMDALKVLLLAGAPVVENPLTVQLSPGFWAGFTLRQPTGTWLQCLLTSLVVAACDKQQVHHSSDPAARNDHCYLCKNKLDNIVNPACIQAAGC